MVSDQEPDWKLKLRYGKLVTSFSHYTLLADGRVIKPNSDFQTMNGPSIMAMNAWATDTDEASDMIIKIGKHIGFSASGKIEIYETEPKEPPRDDPYGYQISFAPYDP